MGGFYGGFLMVRIAIVEDDELYISQLQQYLTDYQKQSGEDFDIKVYRDGDAVTADYKAQHDIILMDIQMRFVDGMTAAEEIRRMDSEVIIIFITNMPQYAIRGYEVGALDYILKPVAYFAFTQKLGRAVARLKKKTQTPVVIQIKGGGCAEAGCFRCILCGKPGAQSGIPYKRGRVCVQRDDEAGRGSPARHEFFKRQQGVSD